MIYCSLWRNKMKNKILALLIVCIFFLGGCEKKEQEQVETENDTNIIEEVTGNIMPRSGGTLKLAMRTTQTLNPLVNEDETVNNILKLIYEPFIKLDASGKAIPNIAESWSFSDDGRTLTVQLKNGIIWHDGSELDAEDVVFSLTTIRNASENSVYKKCVENIANFSAQGRDVVNITFLHAFSSNINYLCFPVISSDYYKGQNVLTSSKNMEPMGTGAFRFESFTPSKSLQLTATESSLKKRPYIDAIEAVIIPDKNTDLYSFDQGVIDAISAVETDMGKYDNSKNTRRFEYTTNYYDFVGFNFNRSILQDKIVRQAIAYAVPKKDIIEGVYLNHAVEAETVINPMSWLYEPNTKKYEYNLTQANQLLQQANWIDTNGDKIRDRTTNEYSEVLRLTILYNAENEERRQTAKRLADELKAIGFDIILDEQPYEIYAEKLRNKDFDLFVGGWQFSSILDFSFLFHTSQINGGSNFISYSNESMDALLTNAYNAVTEEAIKGAYSGIQKHIAEELPYISLVFRKSAVFTKERVNGDIKPLPDNIYDNIDEWFIYDNTNGENK